MDLTGKWTCNHREDDTWGLLETFDTKEEAIEEGLNIFDTETFYVGQLSKVELPIPDVASFLEKLEDEYNYDAEADEQLELFDNISEDDKDWLQDHLELLMRRFYEKTKIYSNWYHIINIERIMGE